MRFKGVAGVLVSFSVVAGIDTAQLCFAQTIQVPGLSPAAESLWQQCQDVTTRVIRQQTTLMHISNSEEFGHLRPAFEALAGMQDKTQIQAGIASTQQDAGRSEGARLNAEFIGCLGNARLAQLTPAAAQNPNGSAAAPQIATAPRNTAPLAPGRGFTAAESQACIDDITAFREDSSRRYAAGGGDAELVRQYTYQIQLFEGRCAGHPQAAAFVSNGRRFLEEARARMGAAAPPPLPPAAPAPGSSRSLSVSSQPSQQIDTGNYSNCVTRILPGEPGAGVYGMLKNNCPFPVDVRYCNDGADPNSFAATMSCTGSRNWGGSGSIGASDKSSALVGGRTYWYACKKPAGVTDSTYNPGQGIAARCK